MTHRSVSLGVLSLAAAVAACEPASITEARDQLSRGPLRTVEYRLPVARKTFVMADVFDSLGVVLDTLPDGLLVIVPDTVSFALFIPFPVPGIAIDTTVTPPPISSTVDSTTLNLGDFTDVMRDATLNTALLAINVSNSADAPVELVNYQLGVVPVIGGVLDSVGGQPAFETDGGGTPIMVDIVDPGDTVFALGPNQIAKVDSLQAAPLVNVLVDKLLAGDTVALVGIGDLHIGDGSVITVNAGDSLAFSVVPIVGLDLTLGSGGASLTLPNIMEGGLDLGPESANDLTANLLDSVRLQLEVVNGVAFGLEVETALVGAQVTGDVFTAPDVVLDTLMVNGATVDTSGLVTAATTDTTGIVLDAQEVGQTLGEFITFGVRVRLLPPPGGRGAIRNTDQLIVRVSAIVWVTVGGGGQ